MSLLPRNLSRVNDNRILVPLWLTMIIPKQFIALSMSRHEKDPLPSLFIERNIKALCNEDQNTPFETCVTLVSVVTKGWDLQGEPYLLPGLFSSTDIILRGRYTGIQGKLCDTSEIVKANVYLQMTGMCTKTKPQSASMKKTAQGTMKYWEKLRKFERMWKTRTSTREDTNDTFIERLQL